MTNYNDEKFREAWVVRCHKVFYPNSNKHNAAITTLLAALDMVDAADEIRQKMDPDPDVLRDGEAIGREHGDMHYRSAVSFCLGVATTATTDIFGTDEFNVAMREHQTMQYKHGRLRYKLGETISDAFKGLDVDAMTEDEYDDVSAAVFEQHFKPLRELQAQIHAKEDQIIGMLHKLRDDIRVAA